MHFLLFVPSVKGQHPSFESLGLDCLTGPHEPSPDVADIDSMPVANCSGRLYSWQPELDHPTAILPDRQIWIPAVPDPDRSLPSRRYWIGVWSDSPPTVHNLERGQIIDGRAAIKTPIGKWMIPSILNLPCSVELHEVTGKPMRVARPEFHAWRNDVDLGLQLSLQLLRGESRDWPLATAFEVAVRLMQLNYRLPRELVTRLGLFHEESSIQAILMHAADPAVLDAALKDLQSKNGSGPMTLASSGTAAGAPA